MDKFELFDFGDALIETQGSIRGFAVDTPLSHP
jgi:hypothetical protein